MKIARFFPEVRSTHLEWALTEESAITYYLTRRDDYDPSLESGRSPFIQVSGWSLICEVWRQKPQVIELPEPLWFKYMPYSLALRGSALLWGLFWGRPRFVCYAIENAGPDRRPRRLSRMPRTVWVSAAKCLAVLGYAGTDKIAFGTAGARENLIAHLPKWLRSSLAGKSKTFSSFQGPCSCPYSPRVPGRVLFLGALEFRKGLDQLLLAWNTVSTDVPQATLEIYGQGSLRELVSDDLEGGGGVRLFSEATRAEIHKALREAEVVVLPSKPSGRWREQVGLPIIEGASHGCKVVTTDETGIALDLERFGQVVLKSSCTSTELANGIVRALRSVDPIPMDSLPQVDGRAAANRWLISTQSAGDEAS